MLAEFHFLRPWWLLALLPLALLLRRIRWLRGTDHAWLKACDAHLLPYLLLHHPGGAGWLAVGLLGLGWLLAVLALAGPTWSKQPQPVFHRLDGRVIVLDLSPSMLAEDLKPSRLSRARFKIADILRRSEEGQTGLVAFAGDAFVVSPLTQDADTITALLPALDPAIMPVPGSRTELGLRKAADLLKQAGFTQGAILLVADGSSGQRALAAARTLVKEGFRVSVLAVGSAEGAPIPRPGGGFVEDRSGNLVVSQLDSAALRELAAAGAGHYAELRTDNTDLDWLLSQDTLLTTMNVEREQRETALWREQGSWLVLLLLPVAALAFRRGWLLGLLLPLCLLTVPDSWAQEVQARLDRTSIAEGETVTLLIEAAGPTQGAEPDLSLLNADFHILGNHVNTRLEIKGQRQTAKTQWIVRLEPRHSGEIRIPSLPVGAQRTAPLQLLVQPQPAIASPGTGPLFLDVQVQPREPYVQAQVLYTIRLFYTVPILEGSLDAPELTDAVIERLGEDTAYEAVRNGHSYRVIERRYAIFPEKSGPLTVPAISFRGRIRSEDSVRPGLFPGAGRRVQVDAAAVTLTVRPRPAQFSGAHWLPSARLTLREDPVPETASPVRVGEPITRTLVLEAKGLTAAQLPALPLPEPAKARLYPDQPLRETGNDGTWITGRREQRVAVIPTQPGELTLPEIRLAWWDTAQDKEQLAVLPARLVTVLPAADAAPAPAPPVAAIETSSAKKPWSLPGGLPLPLAQAALWPGISAALLLLWLATLLGWWWTRQRHALVAAASGAAPPAGIARRALRQACRANDPQRAARALLDWAAVWWPEHPPINLGDLARRLAKGAAAVRELDRALYAPGATPWEGSMLWEAVKKGPTEKRKTSATQARTAELPPLYPERV